MFAIGLTHGLIALAVLRMLARADELDDGADRKPATRRGRKRQP